MGYRHMPDSAEPLRVLRRIAGRERRQGQLHFRFEAGGHSIGYCYIRKNACSAFKRLMVELSPVPVRPAEGENPIHFLIRNHAVRSVAELEACDATLFVYRCPLERAVSLFVNKFVQARDASDIFASFRVATGIAPDAASFRMFVTRYLARVPARRIDPHAWSQAHHLKPICYTHPVPIDSLAARMAELIGPELAGRHFARKVNASSELPALDPERCLADMPAGELARLSAAEGGVPTVRSLLDPELRAELERVYADDLRLITEIGAEKRGALG